MEKHTSRHIKVTAFDCDVLTGLHCICSRYRASFSFVHRGLPLLLRVIRVSLKVRISCAILSKYACNASLEVPVGEVRVIVVALPHSTYLSKAL